MIDELGLFEAQTERKVMTIGWIHSHPSYVSNILYPYSCILGFILELCRFAQLTRVLAVATRSSRDSLLSFETSGSLLQIIPNQ